jgi:hypothetical protein
LILNLMREEDVPKKLNVSVASLGRWRWLSRGPQFVKVGVLVRYRPEHLDSWLAAQPISGAQPPSQASAARLTG